MVVVQTSLQRDSWQERGHTNLAFVCGASAELCGSLIHRQRPLPRLTPLVTYQALSALWVCAGAQCHWQLTLCLFYLFKMSLPHIVAPSFQGQVPDSPSHVFVSPCGGSRMKICVLHTVHKLWRSSNIISSDVSHQSFSANHALFSGTILNLTLSKYVFHLKSRQWPGQQDTGYNIIRVPTYIWVFLLVIVPHFSFPLSLRVEK